MAQNGNAFAYADRLLRNDPNIAFQALALNGTALAHLGEALRSDANQILLQARPHVTAAWCCAEVTRNEGAEEYPQAYIVPAWVPLDSERHRELALRWLARRPLGVLDLPQTFRGYIHRSIRSHTHTDIRLS